MLGTISLITAFSFAAIYPLCFLVSADDPLKAQFHKFHVGLPNTVGGVVLIFVWLMDIPLTLKLTVTAWKAIFLSISWYSWKKEYPSPALMALVSVLGIGAFLRLQAQVISPAWNVAFIGVLGAVIFCAALYAMNLGHWYLNVHGLPIKHLARAIRVFAVALVVRLLWDAGYVWKGSVMYREDTVSVMRFVLSSEGFLVFIGLFFGTIFPLVSLHFAHEVLKLKNTQATTGILYVILCSVLIGDLTYKYYLIKYGIVL